MALEDKDMALGKGAWRGARLKGAGENAKTITKQSHVQVPNMIADYTKSGYASHGYALNL